MPPVPIAVRSDGVEDVRHGPIWPKLLNQRGPPITPQPSTRLAAYGDGVGRILGTTLFALPALGLRLWLPDCPFSHFVMFTSSVRCSDRVHANEQGWIA